MNLSTILSAGSCLVGSTPSNSAPDLKAVLLSRLFECNKRLGRVDNIQESVTLEEAELATAQQALNIVEQVQSILLKDDENTSRATEDTPLIGTRDLAQLRTLLQITFKWGVDILLPRVSLAWPSKPMVLTSRHAKITDITSISEDYLSLTSMTSRLMHLLLPGVKDSLPQNLITSVVLNRHLADLLSPCISLGWLPKSLASDSTPTLDTIRPFVIRLLAMCVSKPYSQFFGVLLMIS
jgi:hypothetical protein